MYGSDQDFVQWVAEEVIPVVEGKGHEKDSALLGHLVNKICYPDHGERGGFLYFRRAADQARAELEIAEQARRKEERELSKIQGVAPQPLPPEIANASIQDLLDDMEDE